MSLLLHGPPFELDGAAITPDFRNMLAFQALLDDEGIPPLFKGDAALRLLFPVPPKDTALGMEKLLWFYRCGRATPAAGGDGAPGNTGHRALDFLHDGGHIYAAFLGCYGLSLTSIDFLHWWEFMALFEALPEDTLIRRIMRWRTADTGGMGRAERELTLRMRKHYALPPRARGAPQPGPMPDMRAWADERYAAAAHALAPRPAPAAPE